jgi:hypothetical protein
MAITCPWKGSSGFEERDRASPTHLHEGTTGLGSLILALWLWLLWCDPKLQGAHWVHPQRSRLLAVHGCQGTEDVIIACQVPRPCSYLAHVLVFLYSFVFHSVFIFLCSIVFVTVLFWVFSNAKCILQENYHFIIQ